MCFCRNYYLCLVFVIYKQTDPSTQPWNTMALLSPEPTTLPLRCKHTATKCATENGDSLVVKKKAHQASGAEPVALSASAATKPIWSTISKKELTSAQSNCCQPSIEDVEDEKTYHPCKLAPKKATNILKCANESEEMASPTCTKPAQATVNKRGSTSTQGTCRQPSVEDVKDKET